MIRKKFRVSDGFIRKWSADIRRISPAEAETQMLRFLDRDLMRSVSDRPKNTGSPVCDKIRERAVMRRKKYGSEGSDRIRAELKLKVSPSTVTNVLREEGLPGSP